MDARREHKAKRTMDMSAATRIKLHHDICQLVVGLDGDDPDENIQGSMNALGCVLLQIATDYYGEELGIEAISGLFNELITMKKSGRVMINTDELP